MSCPVILFVCVGLGCVVLFARCPIRPIKADKGRYRPNDTIEPERDSRTHSATAQATHRLESKRT